MSTDNNERNGKEEGTSAAGSDDSPIDINEFTNTDYATPAQKSVKELLEADTEDESLREYKKKLLGKNAPTERQIVVEPENPKNVIVKNISLIVDGSAKYCMQLPADSSFTFSIKEGCAYKIRFEFYVQREIVSGLKYLHKVSRLGIGVTKELFMLGSYAPREELYVYDTPPEEAPSGVLSRGKYRVRSLITDDDANRWMEWSWNIEITKNW